MNRVKALNGLIDDLEQRLETNLDPTSLEDRIRIQKLVYFAQEFGADLGYDYNIYQYGPYSPQLAEDYFDENYKGQSASYPGDVELDTFTSLLDQKSADYLEIAATVHQLYDSYADYYDQDEVKEHVIDATVDKKEVKDFAVRTVYHDIADAGLIE